MVEEREIFLSIIICDFILHIVIIKFFIPSRKQGIDYLVIRENTENNKGINRVAYNRRFVTAYTVGVLSAPTM